MLSRTGRTVAGRAVPLLARAMGTTTVEPQAPTSFSHDKMGKDKRYQGSVDIPESLLKEPAEESPYSIRGKFKEGRAAYLDMSATTPMDPRVLDAMLPYMVSINPNLVGGSKSSSFYWE